MLKFDTTYARLHKLYYSKFMDELDTEIVVAIMGDPNCEEAVLLNQRVDAAVKAVLTQETILVAGT